MRSNSGPFDAYCWCPAYMLPSLGHAERARSFSHQLCESLDWNLVESPSLAQIGPPSTWADPEDRRQELQACWHHDVLIAARGGYGCGHLIDALPKVGKAPLLIGYSDLTVLHAAWWVRSWGETLYGFMPATPTGERALATTIALARGEGQILDHMSDPGVRAARPGTAEGPCFAACLRVLTGLCGTPEQPDLRGAILAIEDIEERCYAVDRDLTQLQRSGMLTGIRGLVCGRFPAQEPAGYAGPDLFHLMSTWAERLGVPAIVGLPFGHEPDPLTLACGRLSTLKVSDDGTWSFVQTTAERSPLRS